MATFRIASTKSCGIYELADISSLPTPKAVVEQIPSSMAAALDGGDRYPAFLLFSGVVGTRARVYDARFHANRADDYGQALADYITANDLGVVTETPLAQNYNGNMLRVWIWAPKWDVLKAHGQVPAVSLAVNPPPTAVSVATPNDAPF